MGCGCAKAQEVSLPLHYDAKGISSDEEDDEEGKDQINTCDDKFVTASKFVNGYLVKTKANVSRIEIPLKREDSQDELDEIQVQFSPIQIPDVLDNSMKSRNPILDEQDPYSMRMNGQMNPTFGESLPSIFVTPAADIPRSMNMNSSNYSPFPNENLRISRRPSKSITIFSGVSSIRSNFQHFTTPGPSSIIISEHSTRSSQSNSYNRLPEKFNISTQASGVLSSTDLVLYNQPSAFNIVIWSKHSSDRLSAFKKTFYHEFCTQDEIIRVKFKSFYTNSVDLNDVPGMIDVMVYIYTTSKDKKSICNISTNYKHINTHIIYNTYSDSLSEAKDLACEISAICIDQDTPACNYLDTVLYQDRRMFLLLKRIFNKLDNTRSGYVTFKNLTEASVEIGCRVSELDITQMLRAIDTDRDNKINFQEFVSWWKKGRQGIFSFQTMIEKWAYRVSARIPGALKMISQIGVGKSTEKAVKSFSISVGKPFTVPKISFYFKINDSQSLGSVINPRANLLGFRNEEIWFAFSIKTQREISSSMLKSFKRFFKSYLISFFPTSSKEELSDFFTINAAKNPSYIILGISLNIDSPVFQQFLSDFSYLDILNLPGCIPLKVYIEIFIKSGLNKIKHQSKTKFFIPLLEAIKAHIEISHSVGVLDKLISFIFQNTENKSKTTLYSLIPFILRTARLNFSFKSVEDMPKFYMSDIEENQSIPTGSIIIDMLKTYLIEYMNENKDLKELMNICAMNFESDVEVYGKYKELAMHSAIYVKGAVDLLVDIIGNEND